MKKILTAASLLIASVSGSAAVTVPKYDIAKGKVIAESVCGACHGVNGVSTVPAQPNLGGQNVKYLYKPNQLQIRRACQPYHVSASSKIK